MTTHGIAKAAWIVLLWECCPAQAIAESSGETMLATRSVRLATVGDDRRSGIADENLPTAGPDLIIGRLTSCQQFGREGRIGAGTVGLAIGDEICNASDQPVSWFALPNVDHPMVGQQLYRLTTADGSERFEQLGYSWMKHHGSALQRNGCLFGCVPSGTGSQLGAGCSTVSSTGFSAQPCALGTRSAINPYTGEITGGANLGEGGNCSANYPSKNHIGHEHGPVSHRLQVRDVDLLAASAKTARYFGELQCISPHEFNGGNGNQNNNVSWREFGVSGPDVNGKFSFPILVATVQESPAIDAWSGASQDLIEPQPLVDGRAFLSSKVTDLGDGWWHYEYALYNMNLDRAIGSFSVPIPQGVNVSSAGFHQPLHHAPELNTENYSTADWSVSTAGGAITWSTDPFDVDPLANAIRFGTLYNFRFDAAAPPQDSRATIGLFKTSDTVLADAPAPRDPAPVIVHGSAIESFDTIAFSGYVDPRAESDDGQHVNLGLSQVTFHFNMPVEEPGGGLTTAAFVVRETGGQEPPNVVDVTTTDNQTFTLNLDRIITLKEWTTIEARVQSMTDGVPIANLGDLGPGVNEPDRIDIAHLPLDVDQNGTVEPVDLLRFREIFGQVITQPRGIPEDYIDTDRDGAIAPIDLLRFRQLWTGTGRATQPWARESLNHPQP